MRILHVTHNYPRHAGDFSGVFLRSLAREQVSLGHEVIVLAPHAAGLAEREVDAGIAVHRYRYAADAAETIAYTGEMHEIVRRSWAGRIAFLRMLLAVGRATRRLVRESAPDVVHVHWWFPNGLAVWPLRPGVPLVFTLHGTDVFLLRKLAALRPLARAILRSANRVAAVSRALADDAERLGVPPIEVIPMPLDWAVHGTGAARDPGAGPGGRILFVGRLSEQKGVGDLLRALAELVVDLPQVRLVIVGDGAERASLEALASDLSLGSHVEFLGTLPPSETVARYRSSDVLAIPSTTGRRGEREGFGLVAVEGMLAGLPVVATSTGGLVDIVEHGDTGYLVSERNPAAFADALRQVLRSPERGAEMGRRGRERAIERFSPAALAARYVALYEEAGARHAAVVTAWDRPVLDAGGSD